MHILLFRKTILLLLTVFLLFPARITGQETDDYFVLADYKGLAESYFRLRDSILKAEVGSFSFIGYLLRVEPDDGLNEFQMTDYGPDSIVLQHKNKQVIVTSTRFRTFEHDLGYVSDGTYLYLIDGKRYWGYNGRVPHRKISRVEVKIDNKTIELPSEAFADLFDPNLCRRNLLFFIRERIECRTKAFVSNDGSRIYIHMTNARIPHLYEVTWIIRNGKYDGRIVDYAY